MLLRMRRGGGGQVHQRPLVGEWAYPKIDKKKIPAPKKMLSMPFFLTPKMTLIFSSLELECRLLECVGEVEMGIRM